MVGKLRVRIASLAKLEYFINVIALHEGHSVVGGGGSQTTK